MIVDRALQFSALATTLLGLLSAAAVLLRVGDARLSLTVLLDFLLAAGLLQLAASPTAREVAGAALIILIRRLVSVGLHQTSRRHRGVA